MRAIAVYDWGRWVADCPNPACTNALAVEPGQTGWLCRYVSPATGQVIGCNTQAPLDWPPDPHAIAAALADKPESARCWRPEPDQ